MLNSILETRTVEGGQYNIMLQINEDEYFSAYDYLDNEDALELLENYLKYRADDGILMDIQVHHNKKQHIVSISAGLQYADNEKAEECTILRATSANSNKLRCLKLFHRLYHFF